MFHIQFRLLLGHESASKTFKTIMTVVTLRSSDGFLCENKIKADELAKKKVLGSQILI